MKLELDRLDLESEFEDINCSKTKFEHFKPSAQKAIKAVGSATFWDSDRRNCKRIYPTKEDIISIKESIKYVSDKPSGVTVRM